MVPIMKNAHTYSTETFQPTRLERQHQLLEDTRIRHSETLRALANFKPERGDGWMN